MPIIKMAWHILRTFWWVIILVVVAILVGGIYILNRKKRVKIEHSPGENAPSLVVEATRHVQEAVTDFRIEKAIIGTRMDTKRRMLEDIRRDPSGERRRERLANLLNTGF